MITEVLLTQFSPVAVGLRAAAGLGGAVQTFTRNAHSAGVTDQGLTCDPEGRGERKGCRKR